MNPTKEPDPIRALIIDDERLARREMIAMLSTYPVVQVVGQADSVESARTEIKRTNPDVLFLDIQMPRKSGFDLLNEIAFEGKVIFVTAYDTYAIRAFEVNAMDYLLKPVSPERLAASIQRLLENKPVPAPSFKNLNFDDPLFLTFGNQVKFIKVSSIAYITAEKDYSKVCLTDGRSGLVLKSMREWEQRLPGNFFCRVHRSVLINIEMVEKVEKWFNYSLHIYLRGVDQPVTVSRRYAAKIRERFG